MSVQVAKSTGGTTPSAGRRTPLSLSGAVGKSSKTQSQSDTDKDASNSDLSLTTTTSSNTKTVSKNEKSENTTTDVKKINEKSDKKNANPENQTTENINSAKEKGSEDKKKEDKKKEKDSSKKDEKKQENGLNDGKDASKTNGHKDDNKRSGEKNEKATGLKGTSKQKELREQKEKDKDQELKEVKDDDKSLELKKPDEKKPTGKNEDTGTKQSKKKVEDAGEKHSKDEVEKESDSKKKSKKEPETPKKDEKKAREIESVTPTKDITSKQPISNQSIASLAIEKDLKGFGPDGEEMESLVFDSESDTNIGPAETSTPGKILKLKQSAPISVQKTSYERQEIYEKYESANVKDDKPDMSNVAATPLERPQFTSSYRAISGRRSLRPMKEYSFQSTYRESYRKINTELDYTTSSMNVTVGSEIPNESSFSLFGRGKKRERTPPVSSSNDSNNEAQTDVELSPKSPKRARLDFSGIIGIVASPMTLLRAKLSRTKIQCSTPNGKVTSTTKDDEEGVENVSVIATEEMASNDIADAPEDVEIKDTEVEDKEVNDEFSEGADIDIAENMDDFKKPLQVTASLESVNKRRMCNVM